MATLGETELVALSALGVVAVAAAFGIALIAIFFPTSPYHAFGSGAAATAVFFGTIVLGLGPVAILGAPIYATLQYYRKINWSYVVVIGAAPGITSLVFLGHLQALFVLCAGVSVASTTHLALKRLYSSKHLEEASHYG